MIKIQFIFRPAFSMITAIFVILIMASVAAFIMNLSGKITQETTTQYRKEQAILLARSYTEFAIMSATTRDCVPRTITANVGDNVKRGEGYRITVNIRYIGNNAGCPGQMIGGAITTPSSRSGNILVDTYVRYRNPDYDNAINNTTWTNTRRGITYHRRTLQRL